MSTARKPRVSEMIFCRLRDSIAAGQWKPGEKIPSENELCAELGVSRVSVRAAIQKLASIGLVESRQGGGTFVCKLSGDQHLNAMIPFITLSKPDRINVLEFRKIVETESAGLAALRADASMVQRMYAATDRMEQAQTEEEITRFDMEFHRLIAEATRNDIILKVFDVLRDTYFAILKENVSLFGSTGAEYHRKITAAIELRRDVLARQEMTRHLNNTMLSQSTLQ